MFQLPTEPEVHQFQFQFQFQKKGKKKTKKKREKDVRVGFSFKTLIRKRGGNEMSSSAIVSDDLHS